MIPEWCHEAARDLYSRLEKIEIEAEQAAQVEQDSDAGRDVFTASVAEVIAAHAQNTKSVKPRTCSECGLEYAECVCGDWEEEDEEPEERQRCGCPYCFCHNETEYGEPCGDCVNHAHQG